MTDQKEIEVKKRIVEKCTVIFSQRGFAKISMDEIAGSLGMSKKTIYKYFSGKDDLVKSVILEFRDTTLSRIQSVLGDESMNIYTRLVKILDVTGKQLSKIQKPVLEDLKTHMPEFWNEIEEKRRMILKHVYGKLIAEGKKEGIVRMDTDEDFFILMYMSLVTSIVNPEVLSRIPYTPEQVFQNIVGTLFTGILTDEARENYHNKYIS